MNRVLADVVVLVHVGFLAFVVLGGLLSLLWRSALWFHVPALVWGAWIEFSGSVCPLTPLENRLRRAAGGAGYDGGFIDHYITPILYPSGLTPRVQIGLGVALVLFNIGVYGGLLHHRRRTSPSER